MSVAVALCLSRGSILSEEQKQLVHQAGIKEILHDPFVRKALIRLHQDPDVFWDELQASPRLKANVKQLCDLDLVEHEELCLALT